MLQQHKEPEVPHIEAGERGIASGGNMEDVTAVTGDDNFVQVFKNYIQNPPTFYADVRQFVQRHYRVLIALVLAEIGMATLFYRYQDRYLLGWGIPLTVALLLAVAVWSWCDLIGRWQGKPQPRRKVMLLLPGVITLACLGIVGGQIGEIAAPEKFAPEQFGIAIATFGGASDFRAPQDGDVITDQLYTLVETELTNVPDLAETITLRRIGLGGEDGKWAIATGDRIGAKLVIWGRLVTQGQEIRACFHVRQAAALRDNPAIPQAIPTTYRDVDSCLPLSYAEGTLYDEDMAKQSLGIATFSIGLAHFYNRDFREASKQFARALIHLDADVADCEASDQRKKGNVGLIYYYLGRSHQVLGEYGKSEKMLDQALACSPNDLAVILAQMYNYRVMEKNELRKALFERTKTIALPEDKTQNLVEYDRALIFGAMEDQEGALREYNAILQRDPEFFIAYLGAADILIEMEDFAAAEELYTKAEPLAASDPTRRIWLALGRGRLAEARGDTAAAIQMYATVIALDEDGTVASVYYYLAKLYAKTGDKVAAIQNFERLLQASEVAYWAHGAYATFLYENGEYAQAIDQFQAALRYPIYSDAILRAQLGMAYAAVDEKTYPDKETRALAEFERAVATFSACGDAAESLAEANDGTESGEAYIRSEYGRILYHFDRVDAAIAQYECSLKRDPGIAVVTRRNLGQLYESVDEPQKAAAMYQSLIGLCEQIPREQIQLLLFAQDRLQALGEASGSCSLLPVG